MSVRPFAVGCKFTGLYFKGEHATLIGLEVRPDGNWLSGGSLAGGDNAEYSFDFTAFGGSSKYTRSSSAVKIESGAVRGLVADFEHGKEFIVPFLHPDGRRIELVFGGAEWEVEAAIFKACLAHVRA